MLSGIFNRFLCSFQTNYQSIFEHLEQMELLLTILVIVASSIFPTRPDELIMAVTQRRIGPSNSGWYGIISSPVNGCNPIIPQPVLPKVYSWVHFGSSLFPILFFHLAILNYIIPYPFYLVDVYLSSIIVMILIGISLVLTINMITYSLYSSNTPYKFTIDITASPTI